MVKPGIKQLQTIVVNKNKILFDIIFITGMRLSELLGLPWMDVQDKYVYIRQGLHMTDAGDPQGS